MIYVDPLKPANWWLKRASHMFSDPQDDEELHIAAEKLGLKREWFQDHHEWFHHYDLGPGKYNEAVKREIAVPLNWTEFKVILRKRMKNNVA